MLLPPLPSPKGEFLRVSIMRINISEDNPEQHSPLFCRSAVFRNSVSSPSSRYNPQNATPPPPHPTVGETVLIQEIHCSFLLVCRGAVDEDCVFVKQTGRGTNNSKVLGLSDVKTAREIINTEVTDRHTDRCNSTVPECYRVDNFTASFRI